MKKLQLLIYLALVASTLIFSGCGGKTTGGGGGDTNATSSNWDQMKWDQGQWK